jgi:hypothetical protein
MYLCLFVHVHDEWHLQNAEGVPVPVRVSWKELVNTQDSAASVETPDDCVEEPHVDKDAVPVVVHVQRWPLPKEVLYFHDQNLNGQSKKHEQKPAHLRSPHL